MNLNFFDIFNQSPYSFYFLIVDNFLDIQLPKLKNFHLIYAYRHPFPKQINLDNLNYFCLEDNNGTISQPNSGQLLSSPKVIDYIQSTSLNRQVVIIPFKPSAKIEHICHQFDWIVASVPHKLNRFLEDKNQFLKFCQKNYLPTIPAEINHFTKENFTKYQQVFGSDLVIQTHFGWAGNSTFSANNWSALEKQIPLNTLVKFSPLIKGYSLLNNCCLTPNGLVQSPPAIQYTGIKPLTDNPFATVGRQWPSMAPTSILKQIQKITLDFSKKISQINYLGFFGLDFLVDQNNYVYLLECNPRLTASFAFYTQLELDQYLFPLFLLHLAQFIKLSHIPSANQIQAELDSAEICGSEVTMRINGKTTRKHQEPTPLTKQVDPINIPQHIIDQLYV